MADKIIVKAEKREGRGKTIRAVCVWREKVPLTIYGGGEEAIAAAANISDLAAILRTESGPNTLFTLDVEGVGSSDVIFQDRQIHPLKGRLTHADLRRFAKGEKIEVTVPIHLLGEPIGVKEEDGMLEQQLREIKILCEPSNIPESIEYDVSELHVGDSVHVSDLKFGKELEVHEAPDAMVAHVAVVKEPELEADTETTEPEVVGEEGGGKDGADTKSEE